MNDSGQKLIFGPLIRVSTEQQKKKGESLRTQRKQLESAINILGGKVNKWYAGQEHATPDQERKILEDLMRDAKEKKFDALIVCDTSRWSRDNRRSKENLEIFKEEGIRFFVGTMEYNLYDSTQSFLIGINVEAGEYFAKEQTQKSINNRIERAKNGYPTCGKLPYGRTFDKKTGKWGIDEEKKEILEEIAKVYLQDNIGFEELGQRFRMNGSNLDKILTKRSGDLWEQRFRSKAHNIDVTVPTKVPRLLEDEIIQRIKNKAEARKTYNHGSYKYEYLFNRIIFDADTGYALTGTPNAKGKRYYKPYQGNNAHRYMINADILEKAVLQGFSESLKCTQSFQEAIFEGNPVGNVAEELKEKEDNLRKELKSVEKKIMRFIKTIEYFDGADVKSLLQISKSEIETLEQKKKDIEFHIQITKNQLSTLPTVSEIKTIRELMRSQLLLRQKEGYLRSYAALEDLSFPEKKNIILKFFGGKDEAGKKFGIYVKLLEGMPRRYSFEAYGRIGFVLGVVESKPSHYEYGTRVSSTYENSNVIIEEVDKIVIDHNPWLKIKEHISSIN